ncbi:MAG: YhcH/YjgK/YiaL family protein [Dehalococcoidia bacterium]|nr:YhcH/YjgK/YiaL family protein [Dehalococcoidia bacterium]
MIVDMIDKGKAYSCLSPRFARAFDVLKNLDINSAKDGTYELEGRDLYYMIQSYVTKPIEERRFEAHVRYADIQAVYSGCEMMGYTQATGLEVTTPYDEAKDIVFYTTPDAYTPLRLTAKEFVVLFPGEAHMPQCQCDSPSQVKKVVFKVLIGD